MALELPFSIITTVLSIWISSGMLLIAWRYHTRKKSSVRSAI
jgi:hypothetical protein